MKEGRFSAEMHGDGCSCCVLKMEGDDFDVSPSTALAS